MALAAVVGIGAGQAEPSLDRFRVEAFVDGAVREAMRVDHIAGVSIAIVDRSGLVLDARLRRGRLFAAKA